MNKTILYSFRFPFPPLYSTVGLLLMLASTPLIWKINTIFTDHVMRTMRSGAFTQPIHILYFNEADIRALGGWPIGRHYYGHLAKRLLQAGVKVVAFDIFWESKKEHNENDSMFANIFNAHPGIIGSFYFDSSDRLDDNFGRELLQWSKPYYKSVPHAQGLVMPDSSLVKEQERYGFVNLPADDDGVIRSAPLLLQDRQALYPSLALSIADRFAPEKIGSFPSEFQIHYQVKSDQVSMIHVSEFINSASQDLLVLRNSIVIVTAISPQFGFLLKTPVQSSMPVAVVHAQIVDNILSRSWLRTCPVLLIIIMMILLFSLTMRIRLHRPGLILVLPLSLISLLSSLLFIKLHFVFPSLPVVFALSMGLATRKIIMLRLRGHDIKNHMKELESRFHETVDELSTLRAKNQQEQDKAHKEIVRLRRELTRFPMPEAVAAQDFPHIIRHSESPLRKVLAEIPRIARTQAPVLIQGESGTGKELVARAIHEKSDRRSASFVSLNCGALAENLLESELFGHEKGAFTGALQSRIGFFEQADKGTIFLDEITETTPAFQAKLLRVIQDGCFYRVGSTTERRVNVRIVTATNKDIAACVTDGTFRQDLYFRLNVLPILLPPLRERMQDIPVLVRHFLKDQPVKISTEAMNRLMAYHWPGNIRELQNIVARMTLMDGHETISGDWVAGQLPSFVKAGNSLAMEDQILQRFRQHGFQNNSNQLIARELGHLHRSTITEYLRGWTFLFFYEEKFNLQAAVRRFDEHLSPVHAARLKNRMRKYLDNLVQGIHTANAKEIVQAKLRKLPQRFHPAAQAIIEAHRRHEWTC